MMTIRHGKWIVGVIALLVAVLVFPNPPRFRKASWGQCLSNEKQIMMGMLMYAQDSDGRLPPCTDWQAAVMTKVLYDYIFHCPAAPRGAGPDYAMVARWSGVATEDIEPDFNAVVLYEVAEGQPDLRHPFGERDRYDSRYNYLRSLGKPAGMNLGYADGHCKWRSQFPPEVLTQGRDPRALSRRDPSKR